MFSKIKIWLNVLLLTVSIGCINENRIKSDAKDLITKHFKLLNDHNLQDWKKQYSDKVKIFSPGSTAMSTGLYGLARDYELYFTYCKNTHFEISNIIDADSTIVVEYEMIGFPKKTTPPLISNFYPSGIDLKNCTNFKLKENKIILETTYINKILHD